MRYHNITKDDMKNGDGLRAVLWLAGCEHACPGCHNPVTWDADGGLPFDDAARDELFDELGRDYIAGITFSGGDPLHPRNREDVTALCREIRARFPDKTIWLYTGFLWEDCRTMEAVRLSDVVVDGPFLQEQADAKLHWRGSANQRIIDVARSLSENCIVLHEE
ncbi:MAG: anaerobic ribonucleoside-triphosphate reductase activating protein [Intestinibacillus sp.]